MGFLSVSFFFFFVVGGRVGLNSQRAPEFLASNFTRPRPTLQGRGSRKPRYLEGNTSCSPSPPSPSCPPPPPLPLLPPSSPTAPNPSPLLPVLNEFLSSSLLQVRPGLAGVLGTGCGKRGPNLTPATCPPTKKNHRHHSLRANE